MDETDRDTVIRMAVFEHVRWLCEVHDHLTATELKPEFFSMASASRSSILSVVYLLRLHHDGVSAREIGRLLGMARSTIRDNLKRAAAAGLQWPLADDVADEVLEQRLFGRAAIAAGQRRRVEPDLADLARELKRPGMTMMVLWEEYREVHREGYGYSRFCDLLRGFERRLTPVMRQHHVAGDKAWEAGM